MIGDLMVLSRIMNNGSVVFYPGTGDLEYADCPIISKYIMILINYW